MAVAAALGSLVQGVTGVMQGMYQSKVADMNAKIAGENAVRAQQVAGINAQGNDNQIAAQLGEQEVDQAASGVSLSGKSQILTRNSARMLGRADTTNIIEAGNLEAYNYRVQQANFKAEKKAAKISAISAGIGGVLGAAANLPSGSLVGGASASGASSRIIPIPVEKPSYLSSYVKRSTSVRRMPVARRSASTSSV